MIRKSRCVALFPRLALFGLLCLCPLLLCGGQEWKSGIIWPEPPVVDPGPPGGMPEDAIVLFDGKDLSQWVGGERWIIHPDGYAIAKGGSIRTKRKFGDCQLHIEWMAPPEARGHGQGRGNSGVYLMGRYEVQILDSYKNKTYYDGQCAAIYKQYPPLVNACRPPGQWQTFDIYFRAPRFDEEGKLIKPAYMTVVHNGVLVQNNVELLGKTEWDEPPYYVPHGPKEPLVLQYHHCPVRFRNIWIRQLKELEGKRPAKKKGK
jgi:hypothetical protein